MSYLMKELLVFNSAFPVLMSKKGSCGTGIFGPSGYDFSCDSTYMSYYEPNGRGIVNFVFDFIHAPAEIVKEWRQQHRRWVTYERDHRERVEYLNSIIESWFEESAFITSTDELAEIMLSYADENMKTALRYFCHNLDIPDTPEALAQAYKYDRGCNMGWPTTSATKVQDWIQVLNENGMLMLCGNDWTVDLVDFDECGYEFSRQDMEYISKTLDDIFTIMLFEMITNVEECPEE